MGAQINTAKLKLVSGILVADKEIDLVRQLSDVPTIYLTYKRFKQA